MSLRFLCIQLGFLDSEEIIVSRCSFEFPSHAKWKLRIQILETKTAKYWQAPLCRRPAPIWSLGLSLNMELLQPIFYWLLHLKYIELSCLHISMFYLLNFCFRDSQILPHHVWDSLISPLIFNWHECSDERLVFLLLSDQCFFITYLSTAIWIRERKVKSTEFCCTLELLFSFKGTDWHHR